MLVVGIDPGKDGGFVGLSDEGAFMCAAVMPEDVREIMDYLGEWEPSHVFLEKAQAMPKNGAVSMFNYGMGYGILRGVLLTMAIPHTLVPPGTWTRMMHAGASGKEAKKKSLEVARRLFPTADLRKPVSGKKPHEGIVDALLIAEYGRRTLTKGS
jgi:hypothetical protein